MDHKARILETCRAIGRYYKSKGVEYNRQFSAYADDNEIQDGDVAEDLACGFEQR